MKVQGQTEKELREEKVPTLDTLEDLQEYVQSLLDLKHDYGTCVYAMSMAAVVAFRLVARKLGCTGFQASCADMDVVRRVRFLKMGFRILDYENLLYPQYLNEERFPTIASLEDELIEELATEAKKRLAERHEGRPPHPDVQARWELLASRRKGNG